MSQNLTQRDLSATSEYCKFWLRVVARYPLQARMEAPASKGRCCRWFQVFSLRPDLALGTPWLNVKSMYYDLLDLTNQTLNMEVFHPQLWLPLRSERYFTWPLLVIECGRTRAFWLESLFLSCFDVDSWSALLVSCPFVIPRNSAPMRPYRARVRFYPLVEWKGFMILSQILSFTSMELVG